MTMFHPSPKRVSAARDYELGGPDNFSTLPLDSSVGSRYTAHNSYGYADNNRKGGFSAQEALGNADVDNYDDESGDGDYGSDESIKRDLSARHINMIALAGMIGTGLFLTSGKAIARAGPAGALIAYAIMGIVTVGVAYSAGEHSAFMPHTGGFVRHAAKYIEPAMGAAAGWNFWYTMSITVPTDISAAASLVEFWNKFINPCVWITVFLVVVVIVNYLGVRWYGETEVIFCTLKILLILGLIIGGLVLDLGGGPDHDRLGFRYWNNPGAFNEYLRPDALGRFLGLWSVMVTAAFGFGNIQVVAISGTETRQPRKIIPWATRMTAMRVFVFYFLSIFIVGLLVRSDDNQIASPDGTAQSSPFVIAFRRSGVSAVPSIINAVVITSAISSASACIFIASRTLYGLSRDGHAPRIFQHCNRFGTPYYAVTLSLIFSPLVYMTASKETTVQEVFQWFVNITTIAGLIGWIVLESAYLRFFYAMEKQGISRNELPYKAPLQPYFSWFCLFIVSVIVFFSGYDVFFPHKFTASAFLTSYINIPIFLGLYAFFKIFLRKSSRIQALRDIDLAGEFRRIEREKADGRYVPEPQPQAEHDGASGSVDKDWNGEKSNGGGSSSSSRGSFWQRAWRRTAEVARKTVRLCLW